MQRRDFIRYLSGAGALGIGGLFSLPALAEQHQKRSWRHFQLLTWVRLRQGVGPAKLWLPLPLAEATPYQRSTGMHWKLSLGGEAAVVALPAYGVRMLQVLWKHPEGEREVVLLNRVHTRDRQVRLDQPGSQLVSESRQVLSQYLKPTRLLPTDGIVRRTALAITQGKASVLDKAQAIYQWVVAHTCRSPNIPGCGVGNVTAMLTSGNLAGKCADINALFVALARAAGIPARDAYGIRVGSSARGYASLGVSGNITRAQHCRAEFYAQGYGWVPVDPADVRKVMLEEAPGGLPLEHPRVQAAQAYLFGSAEGNWVAYNYGHDVLLPGSGTESLPFLMYPQADVGGRIDSLDPEAFSYSIEAQRLDA